MTLSRARDPFTGINHWKRKHIPAATQICQHLTAARARARAKSGNPVRERANDGDDPVRKRENARKQTRNHDTTAAAYVGTHTIVRRVHARFTYMYREGKGGEREEGRTVERVRWSPARGI